MKQIILAAFISAITAANAAHAQTDKNSLAKNKEQSSASVSGANDASNSNANAISIKAVRNFKKEFKSVSDAQWSKVLHGFMAEYKTGGIATRSMFAENGNLNYTIRHYYEKNLPYEVRANVRSTYWDYSILGVDEIKVPGNDNLIYLVLIQNETRIKRVRVSDGEMEEIESFIRG
ncbi:MAG: hypothetical protein ABJA79_02695 [Parafilimonas sp.]